MNISRKNIQQAASEKDLDNDSDKKPVRKVKPMTRTVSWTSSIDVGENGEPVLTEGIYKSKKIF